MKAGGDAKRNASIILGAQVSKIGNPEQPGDTYQLYTHQDQQRGREVEGTYYSKKARFGARKNCTTFQSKYASFQTWRKLMCQLGCT